MSDLISGLSALDEARPIYQEADRYYNGNVSEVFNSPQLQKALGSESSDFSFNYSRIVITSRLSRMEVASVTSQDNEDADEILSAIWNENALDQEIQDALEAALVFGDSYLIGFPSESGFDIFYNSPYDTRVFYQAENPRKKAYAIKRWIDGERLRVNLYYEDRIEKYISKSKPAARYQDGDFEEYFDEGQSDWPLLNETGSIPVFHLRTSRQYGRPEHKQSYSPQNAINKLLGVQMDSIDYSSAPQRYMLQDSAANSGVNAQSDFGEVDTDDLDGDLTTRLKSGPGGIWNLSGVKSVGQFDPASPDIFVQPFKTFIESMSTVTSTPMHAFNVGALPSGESLRAAEAPLNKRVESLELLFGGVLRELHEYALETLGFVGTKVIVGWSPAATYDDTDVWATVKAKTEAGVPMRIALMEAGYTDAQVSEWYPDEDTNPRSSAELSKLADALQKISAAVTLGVITKEEARRVLPQDFLSELPVVDGDSVIEALNNSYPPEPKE